MDHPFLSHLRLSPARLSLLRDGTAACLLALFVGLALLVGRPAHAQNPDDPSPHSSAELVSEMQTIEPGEPFTVALRLTLDDGWHSYWKNPGDSGQKTRVEWDLPDGFTAGDIQWPVPHRIDSGPLTSYGYSGEVLHLVEVTPPSDLTPGETVRLSGEAGWLVCADVCLPASEPIELTLAVGEAAPGPESDAIDAARTALPKASGDWTVRATRSEGSYALRITPPSRRVQVDGATFFAAEKAVIDHAAPQPVSREDGTYLLALQQSEYAAGPVDTLRGVLTAPEDATWPGGAAGIEVAAPVVEESEAAAPASGASQGSMTLGWALLFAFAGGLILNLMPCVFPVLSIKILSIARQSGDDPAVRRRHGLTFGAGVLVSFWVLAGLLLALRAGGSQIGWGFQLQSPLFVGGLALLFFAIGLNLLGVFEIGSKLMNWGGQVDSASAGDSYTGSFLSGVLATVVATPCTAPLMGAALGFALSLSTAGALFIFTALGAGMAAPYVVLSASPRLLDRLPKPGSWMETLRQALSFPMFATSIWLIWVFGQQAGVSGMTLLLVGLLGVGLAAWIVGRWNAHRITFRQRLVTRTLALLLVAGGVASVLAGAQSSAIVGASASGPTQASASSTAWQSWSPQTVDRLRSEGRPVFVDFTAAWCLTCQVNKRTTLSAASVEQAFSEKNVALLRADWTNRDSTITRALESHGRSGVPLYVLYPGDGSNPRLLPEVLSPSIVLDKLQQLPSKDDRVAEEV